MNENISVPFMSNAKYCYVIFRLWDQVEGGPLLIACIRLVILLTGICIPTRSSVNYIATTY